MAQPTLGAVHINRPLTNISVAYIQRATDFIATRVFPIVRVQKQSDSYFTYTKEDWFRDEAQKRAPGDPSAGSGYNVGTDNYRCDVFALHKDVPDQIADNTDAPMDPFADATRFVTQRLLLRQEKQWAADAFGTGIWGTSFTPANLWSNFATSTPISDVETAKRTVLANTGFLPNTLVLGYDVYIQLVQHPEIIDRIGNNRDRIATMDWLGMLFGLSNTYVAMAVENSAAEGETASYGFVQGKHALVCYVAPNPGLLEPSAGYTFVWDGASEGLGEDVGIKRFYMDELAATRVEGQVAFDNKLVATDLGYFFDAVVA